MKTLTFIASDFISLTEPSGFEGTQQFVDLDDCPAIRAANRQGISGKEIRKDSKAGYDAIFFNYTVIEKVRRKLLKGAKSVNVRLYN